MTLTISDLPADVGTVICLGCKKDSKPYFSLRLFFKKRTSPIPPPLLPTPKIAQGTNLFCTTI